MKFLKAILFNNLQTIDQKRAQFFGSLRSKAFSKSLIDSKVSGMNASFLITTVWRNGKLWDKA